jgi:hypothetical protein
MPTREHSSIMSVEQQIFFSAIFTNSLAVVYALA